MSDKILDLFAMMRDGIRDPAGLEKIRAHNLMDRYGTSEAMRVIPEMEEIDKQYKQWMGLEHIKTVEHGECEEGGIKWGKFTSYYRFKNTPWYKKIWINFEIWWRS